MINSLIYLKIYKKVNSMIFHKNMKKTSIKFKMNRI